MLRARLPETLANPAARPRMRAITKYARSQEQAIQQMRRRASKPPSRARSLQDPIKAAASTAPQGALAASQAPSTQNGKCPRKPQTQRTSGATQEQPRQQQKLHNASVCQRRRAESIPKPDSSVNQQVVQGGRDEHLSTKLNCGAACEVSGSRLLL